MVILEDYIKKESSHWCEGKVCDIPHHYISKEKASGGYTHVVSWWTEGRSFAGKGKEKTFFFFQEIKRFNNTRLFRMKEVHTSEEAYTNLFLSPICIHIHYTALNKKRFLTSKYTPSVRATYRPRNFKVYGRHHQTEILSLYSIAT